MKVKDLHTQAQATASHRIGLKTSALPEVQIHTADKNSDTGVSTNYTPTPSNKQTDKHWYALRSTYGQERKAYDFIVSHGGTAFYPTISTVKEVDGKKKMVEQSRIPNILFAHGTKDEVETFVYDNLYLPYLRFYYEHHHQGSQVELTPLIVPDHQMESLRIICAATGQDTLFYNEEIRKFAEGDLVRITGGQFKGVTGRIARFKGQQRVGVVINGCMTAVTAYVRGGDVDIV